MRKPYTSSGALALALSALLLPVACSGQPKGEEVDLKFANSIEVQPADVKAGTIASAATAFLRTLDATQRKATVYAFDDNVQRSRWSNFPAGFVKRGGIMRGDLNAIQRSALDALLAEVLSEAGVRNVRLQMAADDALKGGNGPIADFGSDYYSVAFLGEPSTEKPWMLQFGGHHLAINITFVGPKASFSPMLTGGQPLTVPFDGKPVYITRKELDAAHALLKSLNADQRKAAVVSSEPIQLLLGPGEYRTTVAPEGVRAAELNEQQRTLLLAVVEARIGQFNQRDAQAKMAAIARRIQDVYFGWWGPQDKPGTAYFRITGPEIVMEYAPQQMRNDDPTEHAHNMYRDPINDYGSAWVAPRK